MKEEVAKTKWCPMTRHTTGGEGDNEPACNRIGGEVLRASEDWNKCIASECMIWVQTDNECEPEDVAIGECYPAGRCGLIKC